MTKQAINTRNQSMEEFLIEELDEIYYPGYAQEIIESDPAKFDWELAEFIGQFSNLIQWKIDYEFLWSK